MTSASVAPIPGMDANPFSSQRRSDIRCSRGRNTCCGSDGKCRNIHIKYARCFNFSRTNRGPIAVSTWSTPSTSFNPHDLPCLERMVAFQLNFWRRAIIAPQEGQREENLKINCAGLTGRAGTVRGRLSVAIGNDGWLENVANRVSASTQSGLNRSGEATRFDPGSPRSRRLCRLSSPPGPQTPDRASSRPGLYPDRAAA